MTLKKNTLSRGFSLIELLVVVAIIAILIALGAASFVRQIAKGNDSKRKADLNRIKISLEEFEKDHNCYPDPSTMTACGSDVDIPVHPYLSNVPCDPVAKTAYLYETDGLTCPQWFRIYTTLQNTKDAQLIPNIGPGNAYNFYASSENAPRLGGTNSGGTFQYGCIGGYCQPIPLDGNGDLTCTSKTFDVSNCGGVDCGNPVNECK